jgi:AraC-like DNA-binding protein
MNFRLIFPTDAARKYIRYFWILDERSAEPVDKKFKIVADVVPGLVFQQNPEAFLGENESRLPQVFLYGLATQHSLLNAHGNFQNIGVSLQPLALKAVFGVDAFEFADRHIDINDMLKTTIADQFLNLTSIELRVAAIEDFILKLATRREAENGTVIFATEQLQQGKQLKELQTELNISARSLERLFKQHIGIAPILYSRICRFQNALESIRHLSFSSLTDIALQCNYFDQSHFIRDFKRFAGATPTHFLQKAYERVPNFPEWQ